MPETKPVELCESGRKLRYEFSGVLFLLGDTFRVVDLKNKVDKFTTQAQLIDLFGEKKWNRLFSKLTLSGYHESSNYRIEAWSRAPELH